MVLRCVGGRCFGTKVPIPRRDVAELGTFLGKSSPRNVSFRSALPRSFLAVAFGSRAPFKGTAFQEDRQICRGRALSLGDAPFYAAHLFTQRISTDRRLAPDGIRRCFQQMEPACRGL